MIIPGLRRVVLIPVKEYKEPVPAALRSAAELLCVTEVADAGIVAVMPLATTPAEFVVAGAERIIVSISCAEENGSESGFATPLVTVVEVVIVMLPIVKVFVVDAVTIPSVTL